MWAPDGAREGRARVTAPSTPAPASPYTHTQRQATFVRVKHTLFWIRYLDRRPWAGSPQRALLQASLQTEQRSHNRTQKDRGVGNKVTVGQSCLGVGGFS